MLEPGNSAPSLRSITAAFAALLLGWACVLWPVPKAQFNQSDTFWLIEVGRRILEKGSIPSSDPYSFTAAHNVWTVYQWLSETLFALADRLGDIVFGTSGLGYRLGDLIGVSLFGMWLFAVLFCVIMFRRLIRNGCTVIVSFVSIAALIRSVYLDIAALRPQLLSFLFFWLLLSECENLWWSRGSSFRKSLLVALVVGLAWTNCHISFVIGTETIAIYCILSLLRMLGSKEKANIQFVQFASIFAVFGTTTLLNPYGARLWLYLLNIKDILITPETGPLNWRGSWFLTAYCLSALAMTFFARKKVSWASIVLSLALLLSGCACSRLILYFCIAACPLLAHGLTHLGQKVPQKASLSRLDNCLKPAAFTWYYLAGIIVISTAVVLLQPTFLMKSTPVKAAEFLETHRVKGNLFCTTHAGSYLIYRFRGSIPVFSDTRIDLYGGAFLKRELAAMADEASRKQLFADYGITEALAPSDSTFAAGLASDPQWRLIYNDGGYAIFVLQNGTVRP